MEFEDSYREGPKPKYECLLFDVDDTLYSLSSGLSSECKRNIMEYMINNLGIKEDKAPEMCVQLYKAYGTTMAGLRAIGYDFDYDDYHSYVHGRLPYEFLKPDPVLRSLLHGLPVRKVIFSNANEAHVAKILGRLCLDDCFDDVICFETLNPNRQTPGNQYSNSTKGSEVNPTDHFPEYNGTAELPKSPIVCKPFEDAFEQVFRIAGINPQKTLFFDDSIRNLQTGKRLGLRTVWVGSSHRGKGTDYAFESIHNIQEALPELWDVTEKPEVCHSEKIAIETSVRA